MNFSRESSTLRRLWAADLDRDRLYAVLALRTAVFVVEQRCAHQELDGRDLDSTTRHFWLETSPTGPVWCYLRLLEEPTGEFRIGRVCATPERRGRGQTRRLMEAALVEVGTTPCVLDSQVDVFTWYERFGFRQVGDPYDDAGIPHVPMRREPTAQV
jgi:ElaA protein